MSLSVYVDEVRRFDRDRFLSALLAREEPRQALLALYAFNLDVAGIREQVAEPALGMIRLQWWRDALDGFRDMNGVPGGKEISGHPVVVALADIARNRPFDLGHLETLLDAREADWEMRPFADTASLLVYAGATAGRLNLAALDILGAHDAASQAAGRHIGTAWAVVGLIRAVSYHARMGRICLPADAMAKYHVSEDGILSGKESEGLKALVLELGMHADNLIEQARHLKKQTVRLALPVLFQARQAEAYLQCLRHVGGNPFDRRLTEAGPALFRFLTTHIFGFW